jgi:hypothetical protein
MPLPRTSVIVVVSLLGGALGSNSRAEDEARASYRELCRGMNVDFSADAASLPQEFTFTVKSTMPTVRPGDIQFTLESGKDAYEIPVAINGVFKLPVSKPLFDADAMLASNQPKGTLIIGAIPLVEMEAISVPLATHAKEGRIDYNTLVRISIERRQQVIKELAQQGNAEDVGPRVGEGDGEWYIVLRATGNESTAKAVVVSDAKRAEAGPIERGVRKVFGTSSPLKNTSPGAFVIPYSESLRDQNPMVSLSPDSTWSCAVGVVANKPK